MKQATYTSLSPPDYRKSPTIGQYNTNTTEGYDLTHVLVLISSGQQPLHRSYDYECILSIVPSMSRVKVQIVAVVEYAKTTQKFLHLCWQSQ